MKQTKCNIFLILLTIGFLQTDIFGQGSDNHINYNKTVSFPSPNAAALGKFGFIPVNYSTGVPNVAIPIWEIKEQELTLPITLNYNNNGLRVSEEASWVGFGWALSSGGAITRTVHGAPDIEGTAQMNNEGGLKFDQLGNPAYIDDLTANRIAEGYYDGEPDMFVFNFAGYSGKFILYQNQAIQLTHSHLRIVKLGDNFMITTDEGVTYEFAKREQTLITSSSVTLQLPIYTSAWLLTSISTANQSEVIEFIYSSSTENIAPNSNYTIQHSFEGNPGPYNNQPPNQDPCADMRHNIGYGAHSMVYSWRLERIKSRSVEIEFKPQDSYRLDLNGNCRALDEIKIYPKGSSTHIRKFKFNYDYFGGTADKNYARLKLTSLLEYGIDTNAPKSYTLEYYEGSFPSKTGYAMDHWGYYNGANGNTNLIPHLLDWQTYGDAYRVPSSSMAVNSMLKKIGYPTKGYTSFIYVQNQYNQPSGVAQGPGMRLSQMQDYDGEKTRYVNYAYENPLFFGEPIYLRNYTFSTCKCAGADENGNCVYWANHPCNHYTITGENTSLYAGLGSFSLAYQKVTESIGINGELGKTEYIYEPSPQYDLDHDMKLKERTIRNASGITIKKIVNTNNSVQDQNYNAFRPELTVFYLFCNVTPRARDTEHGYILQDYNIDMMYFVRSYWHYISKTVETEFDAFGNPTVAKETNYKYNSTPIHRYPTRIETTQSNGDTNIQFFKYPKDYNTDAGVGSDAFYNSLKTMKDINLNPVVEAQTIVRDAGGQETITDAKLMLYKSFVAGNNIQLAEVHSLETQTGEPVNSSYTSGNTFVFNHLPYTKMIRYNYNSLGRMISRQTNTEQTTYLWGYNDALPIVKAIGVSYETLLSAYQASGQNPETIRNQPALSKALVTTYTYNLLIGPATVSDANDQKTYYNYDDFGRLKTVKDNNLNIIKNYEYNYKASY
jgi:YD repeat-containing protein